MLDMILEKNCSVQDPNVCKKYFEMLFNIHMTARFPFLLCLFDILMLRNSNLKKKNFGSGKTFHAVDFKRAPPQRKGTDMDPSTKSSTRFVENGSLLYLII